MNALVVHELGRDLELRLAEVSGSLEPGGQLA
jgi:hypothetical protein